LIKQIIVLLLAISMTLMAVPMISGIESATVTPTGTVAFAQPSVPVSTTVSTSHSITWGTNGTMIITNSQPITYYPGVLIGMPEPGQYTILNGTNIGTETLGNTTVTLARTVIRYAQPTGTLVNQTTYVLLGITTGARGYNIAAATIIWVNQTSGDYITSETDIIIQVLSSSAAAGSPNTQDVLSVNSTLKVGESLKILSSVAMNLASIYGSDGHSSIQSVSQTYTCASSLLSTMQEVINENFSGYNQPVPESYAVISFYNPYSVASVTAGVSALGTNALGAADLGSSSDPTTCNGYGASAGVFNGINSVEIDINLYNYYSPGGVPASDSLSFDGTAEFVLDLLAPSSVWVTSSSSYNWGTPSHHYVSGTGEFSFTPSGGDGYAEIDAEGIGAMMIAISDNTTNAVSLTNDNQITGTVNVICGIEQPPITDTSSWSLGACVLSVEITASDSLDPNGRYWAVYIDQSPPGGSWWNEQPAPAYIAMETSGSQISFTIGEASGLHTVYFIVSQDGGSQYGTYSGTATLNGKGYPISGVDATTYNSWSDIDV
jgi:hypothetical protein